MTDQQFHHLAAEAARLGLRATRDDEIGGGVHLYSGGERVIGSPEFVELNYWLNGYAAGQRILAERLRERILEEVRK